MKIVVIGAGMGGMAAAICCARAGHAVTVLEKNSHVGGKIWTHTAEGFTFDCGPSLLTLPSVLRELCAEQYDALKIKPLSQVCNYFWDDGTEIASHRQPDIFAANIARATEDKEAQYFTYFQHTKNLFYRVAPFFLTHDIRHYSIIKHKSFWKSLPRVPLRNSCVTLHAYNRLHFRSLKNQQIFDRFATYTGSSPYHTSATYSLVSFIEHGLGAYYSAAGVRVIPRVLAQVAERYGARIVLNEQVERIEPRNKTQTRHIVSTAQDSYECEKVIANTDALQLESILGAKLAEYKPYQRATSAIIYLWGINREVERLGFHNILFSNNYRTECADIFAHFTIPNNPTIYINISSKQITGDAPRGMENWFVMINVPARVDVDWNEIARTARIGILRRISRLCHIDIASHIVYEKILTPVDFARIACDKYGSLYGKNIHGPLGILQRPHTTHRRYRHLYRCGGTAHPGGGIPLALLSGWIAANRCDPRSISSPTLGCLAAP